MKTYISRILTLKFGGKLQKSMQTVIDSIGAAIASSVESSKAFTRLQKAMRRLEKQQKKRTTK